MANGSDRTPSPVHVNVLFVVGFVVLVCAIAGFAVFKGATAGDIALIGFVAFSTVIVAFAAAVLWQIVNGRIDLFGIVSEPDDVARVNRRPKASLSRFQFLVFTFVVAGLFLMLSIESGSFVNIPENVLVLIGLSGTSFIVSKAVGQAKPKASEPPEGDGDQGREPISG